MKFAKRVCSSLSIPAFGRSRLERDRAGETELKHVGSKMAVMMFTLAVLLALILHCQEEAAYAPK